MKKLLPLVFVVSIHQARGQTEYEKLYTADGTLNLIELQGDSILVSMGWGPTLTLLDGGGNVVRPYDLYRTEMYAPLSIARLSAGECYFIGNQHDGYCSGGWRLDPVIGRMDTSGDVVSLRQYQLNSFCGYFMDDLSVTQDGGVIAWGQEPGFFALRVNPGLDLSWAKRIARAGSFQFIKELPGGDLLAGITMDTAGAVVARMDANGDFLWCRSYIRPSGVVHDCVIENDSSFYITGVTDNQASANPKLFMLKLNGTGDVQWCKGYDIEEFWAADPRSRMVRASDGNYVILGTFYDGVTRPFLMKVDQNGDTLWTRSVNAIGFAYETRDLLASSDGGYVCSGTMLGDLPDGNTGLPYIFKTDSMGHLPCDERWQPIQVMDLFPVDSSFTLASIDGATAIPISVSDTIFPPITVYDACLVTPVPPPPQVRKFRVYPNPNTGHFTVAFKDPLQAESYYSVYDALGKLLYQRPLAPSTTVQEVDLSRFGKGTYVIKCTDPGGVSYERVVVE